MFQEPLFYLITGIVAAASAGIFFPLGQVARKKKAEKAIGSAEEESRRILSDAIKNAEAKKKELLIEVKEEIHTLRNEADKDIKDRRSEVSRQERRIQQKEESLDKKLDNIEKKEEAIQEKARQIEIQLAEAEKIKAQVPSI